MKKSPNTQEDPTHRKTQGSIKKTSQQELNRLFFESTSTTNKRSTLMNRYPDTYKYYNPIRHEQRIRQVEKKMQLPLGSIGRDSRDPTVTKESKTLETTIKAIYGQEKKEIKMWNQYHYPTGFLSEKFIKAFIILNFGLKIKESAHFQGDIQDIYHTIIKHNPELQNIQGTYTSWKIDIIFGVISGFTQNDIKFYIETLYNNDKEKRQSDDFAEAREEKTGIEILYRPGQITQYYLQNLLQ